ncbi:MAG: AraC family transcriptional regulator [Bacteroidia bacterium]|nr:AraC family transcriptional regulator [Bacteroidia bacterium]
MIMDIREFDPGQGRYRFTVHDIDTAYHAHPAMELVIARIGTFCVETPEMQLDNLSICLIQADQPHRLSQFYGICDIWYRERGQEVWDWASAAHAPHTGTGVVAWTDMQVLDHLISQWEAPATPVSETRIVKCLELIEQSYEDPATSTASLAARLGMSPGRLSHLFKTHMGTSLRRYLVWVRLRVAIRLLLIHHYSLTEAALMAGFYDSPHFSKRFKAFLGVRPSEGYPPDSIIQASV